MADLTKDDPFLLNYQPSDLRISSEFLTNWLPFLSKGLCQNCTQTLSDRIRSLTCHEPDGKAAEATRSEKSGALPESNEHCCDDEFDKNSTGSAKSLGSWKDGANGWSEAASASEASRKGILGESPYVYETASARMSWADMAQEEDEFAEEEEQRELNKGVVDDVRSSTDESKISKVVGKPNLSREEREYIRLVKVKRKKDYMCFEKIKGKLVNIAEGLELHTGVFSAAEQKRIVDLVYELQEKGKRGQLKERTYSAPRKWMRGKGRVTIQFGCGYNYATDKNGNPPGILQNETVDPIPSLFKVIIRRLIRWHVLPPTCVPDSCIVNIYDEGDCIPPHIDNHDFLRPFCTVSFLSECNILFGSDLKSTSAGEFNGVFSIPLPVGSVLVLNGNGADVAKHCVPSVPTKRISITFRKMDETKWPIGFVPEPDLQGIQPLAYDEDRTKRLNSPRLEARVERQPIGREGNTRDFAEHKYHSEPRYPTRGRRGIGNKWGRGEFR